MKLGAAVLLFLLILRLGGTALAQTVTIGVLPPDPDTVVDAFPGMPLTAINGGAPDVATLRNASFAWSARPCPQAVKIRFFRSGPMPGRGPTPVVSFAERGPFDVNSLTQSVSLEPPVEVQPGDSLAIVRLTPCGNPMAKSSTGSFLAFAGDVSSLTPGTHGEAKLYQNATLSLQATGVLPVPDLPQPAAILPIVGVAQGVNGAFFRTSVQLHNPTSTPASGRLVLRPSGRIGAETDPFVPYSLAPFQAVSIPDLFHTIGFSGLASADLQVAAGPIPIVIARVFNDAGPAGTTGFTEEPIAPGEALTPERFGYLILPYDLDKYRFNIGLRTLGAHVSVLANLYDSTGQLLTQALRRIPPHFHLQESAAQFLGSASLPENGRVLISLVGSEGRAIVYGATVDNQTNDPSFQVARQFP
jgi:hypothetical protein